MLVFSSSRKEFRCPSRLVIKDFVRLSCTSVNLKHKIPLPLPREAQVDHLFLHNSSGNAEFPAVTAYQNQSHTFSPCSFLQSLEHITAYLISFTMAVAMKGVSLSGDNQCQMDPLHALVHSHQLVNHDCFMPLTSPLGSENVKHCHNLSLDVHYKDDQIYLNSLCLRS